MANASSQLYILLKDKVALRSETGFDKNGDTLVFIGSLWKYMHSQRSILKLSSLDFEGVVLRCYSSDVGRLTQEECKHLIALSTCNDRLVLCYWYSDLKWRHS